MDHTAGGLDILQLNLHLQDPPAHVAVDDVGVPALRVPLLRSLVRSLLGLSAWQD